MTNFNKVMKGLHKTIFNTTDKELKDACGNSIVYVDQDGKRTSYKEKIDQIDAEIEKMFADRNDMVELPPEEIKKLEDKIKSDESTITV